MAAYSTSRNESQSGSQSGSQSDPKNEFYNKSVDRSNSEEDTMQEWIYDMIDPEINDMSCPICTNLILDPVKLIEDQTQRVYCRYCLVTYSNGQETILNPMTGLPICFKI